MKPRIFIGSTSERLEIAYAIQTNLEHDAYATVWTQGVFKLSENTIDSLINTMNESDFAVFVFHPDDVTHIRKNPVLTVRDNLIFELGLFMGKLGKNRVFFLVPRNIESLHLPTDLLGITPGTYDHTREDGNLQAAIGTFCNQIREATKKFIVENIEDIQNESEEIKKIVLDKPKGWEVLFVSELLNTRLTSINKGYEELALNLVVDRGIKYSGQEFFDWFGNTASDFERMMPILRNCLEELNKSFGPLGVPAKTIEMKNAVDRIIQLCKEFLNWEYELNKINPPEELLPVKELMRNWTKDCFINPINTLPELSKIALQDAFESDEKKAKVGITLEFPERIKQIVPLFKEYFKIEGN